MTKFLARFGFILLLATASIHRVSANTDFKNGLKDSGERRGTENWEQPQGSFFVVPGIFMGLALLVLFINRKK